MELRNHAKFALDAARRLTESVLEAFVSRDDWLFQVDPHVNHAMWITGHLGLADNAFAAKYRPDGSKKPAGWEALFWFGSDLRPADAYPEVEEVRAYFQDRRRHLLSVLEEVSDDELAAPAPTENSPIAGAPCLGHIFLFAAYHEGIHCGQLTAAHRGLGNRPLYQPRPTSP